MYANTLNVRFKKVVNTNSPHSFFSVIGKVSCQMDTTYKALIFTTF